MRNKLLCAVIGMGMAAVFTLRAQTVPATINYQGRLTDNTPSQTPINATCPPARCSATPPGAATTTGYAPAPIRGCAAPPSGSATAQSAAASRAAPAANSRTRPVPTTDRGGSLVMALTTYGTGNGN